MAAADPVRVNNIAYNWTMIQLISPELAGANSGGNPTILQGVSAIKWNKKREVKPNYGLNGKQVSRGLGNEVCTASITMDYATQKLLRAGVKSLMEIGSFDLVINFADPINQSENAQDYVPGDATNPSAWTSEKVTLKGCFFNEDGFESQNDDDNITKEFDLNPFDIEISV
jgi:hypothetical protein